MQLISKFFLTLLLMSSLIITAQYKPAKNYTTANGLPNNAVRSLFLDQNYDVWIGTENGICKFENGTFSTLELPKKITNNSCWDINQDSEGNMWFASYGGGIYKYDGKRYTVFNASNGLPNTKARKLLAYKNKMYVGTELGVAIIDIKTNKISVPKGILPHFGVFIVTDFVMYKNEVYFSTSNEGVFKIVYKNRLPRIERVLKLDHAFSLGLFDNTLFVGGKATMEQLDVNDLIENKNTTKSFGSTTVWDYAIDKYNKKYAAAWGVFDLSGGLFTIANNEITNVSKEYGIDSQSILNVVYNPENDCLYVSSKDKGIYEVQLDQTIVYNPFDNKKIVDFETLNHQKVILHQDGISILDGSNFVVKTITNTDFKKAELAYINTTKNKLPTHSDGYFELEYSTPASKIEFYEIVKHEKSLWITSNIGVYEMNFNGSIINYLPIHSYKIGFTADGQFIETIPYAGVRIYDNVYHLQAKHFSEFDKSTPLNVVGILNNKNKTYLVSVFQGLFKHQNNTFQSLLNDNIWSQEKLKFITKNNKGNLIIASEFGAVTIIDDSKSFKVLKNIDKDQIIGNTLTFLESYKDYIFIGTEQGITIYRNGQFQFFDKEQGLSDAAISSSAIFGNQLWLGTQKGYFSINLDKLTANKKTVSSIAITNITINSVPIKSTNYHWFTYTSKELNCEYNQNTIAVDFVPKGHTFPNKLKFRYRLKSDDRWSPYTDKPYVYLSYLPANTYQLEIEVYDLHSGKTTCYTILTITIKKPFWETAWFYTAIGLCLVLCFLLIVSRIKKQAKQKAATERKLAKAKLEALLSQMNPHFTFNALTSIQSFVFNKDVLDSSIYISEVASLMRQTLDNSSNQTITIADEIRYLQTYISIENKRFDGRIQSQIIVDQSILQEITEIPTMLLQPFVENVFKHAFTEDSVQPAFTIEFTRVANMRLQILISDNGNGKKETTKNHVSKGLSIAKERLQIMQPTNENPIVIIFSETGTTVKIKLIIQTEKPITT